MEHISAFLGKDFGRNNYFFDYSVFIIFPIFKAEKTDKKVIFPA